MTRSGIVRRLIRDVSLSVAGQDFRFAVRGLRRSPGLSAAIIGTIGIGVGMNAALFTVVVEGPRMTGVIEARARQTNVTYEQMERTYLERISLRRMVTAGDVAAAVAYLLSPAGRNISGLSLNVDGNVESL